MQRKSGRAGILFSVIGITALAFLGGAGGCSSKPSPPRHVRSKPEESGVKVACPGDLPATLVERYGARWASQRSARLAVVPYDPALGPQAATGADVWVIPTAQMPR